MLSEFYSRARMNPSNVDVCYYHGNCHDGALAAAIVKQHAPPHCEFVPTWWESLPGKFHVHNKNVLFVDLTPSPTVLTEVLAKCKNVFIIDHHESARSVLLTQLTMDMVLFDSKECGATLAWKWVHGPKEVPMPAIVKYIKALDMFDWSQLVAEDPMAMSISRCIEHMVSPTVNEMEAALLRGGEFMDQIRSQREVVDVVIERQLDKCFGSIEYYTLRHTDRIRVAVVNVQHFINHIAHRIYSTTNVHVVWLWYKHGASRKIRIMLRSNGKFDCQHYAFLYGGGGTFECCYVYI